MKLIAIFLIGLIVLSGCLITEQWEYTTIDTIDNPVFLNEYSREGWELVAVTTIQTEADKQDYTFYFKRRVKWMQEKR